MPLRGDESRFRERGASYGPGLSAGKARQLSGMQRIARSPGVLLLTGQGLSAVCQWPSINVVWPDITHEGK